MAATVIKPAASAPDSIDAKVAASNEAAAASVAQPTPDPAPAPAVEPGATVEPTPMAEVLPTPEPDPASAQAVREADPSEPHDFLDEAWKRDQSGAHPVEMSPAEVVASDDPAHTTAKGLSEDGSGANGMVNGDRPAGL